MSIEERPKVAEKIRILCVDDEPRVLEGLTLNLRRGYLVTTAPSGPAALAILEKDPAFAVITSDMRMPGMDGAAFLAQARVVAPDAVRILLTGQAELSAAISAVNDGQIFRFLTKPCPPAMMLASVDAAAEQHRLITAERVLLEQTVRGSVRALTDVLALTSPASFGRAQRIKTHVTDIATRLGVTDRWQVEVAAMLSQLGFATLPPEVAEKVYNGDELSDGERLLLARVPAVTDQLVGNIPRLEGVRAILAICARRPVGAVPAREKAAVEMGAKILGVALGFDALEASGNTASVAIETLRARGGCDPAALRALAEVRTDGEATAEVREIPLSGLVLGMRLLDDVKTTAGMLLIARGFEVTEAFMERVRHFRPGMVREPVRVLVRGASA
jgi:CheY-like chemotaxis protein